MVKIIILLLFLINYNYYAQFDIHTTKEFFISNNKEYCVLKISLLNKSDSTFITCFNNWRVSLLYTNNEKYIGFPVIPNIINRLIIYDKQNNPIKNFLGEDSNLGYFTNTSFKIIHPQKTLNYFLIIEEENAVQLLKNDKFAVDFLYNIALLDKFESLFSQKFDYSWELKDLKGDFLVIPIKEVYNSSVKNFEVYNGINKFKRVKIDNILNSIFEKRIITF